MCCWHKNPMPNGCLLHSPPALGIGILCPPITCQATYHLRLGCRLGIRILCQSASFKAPAWLTWHRLALLGIGFLCQSASFKPPGLAWHRNPMLKRHLQGPRLGCHGIAWHRNPMPKCQLQASGLAAIAPLGIGILCQSVTSQTVG